jgi:NAD(P)-dependent dehydrogenase (short-subunit alcohol dehydrogenase family)
LKNKVALVTGDEDFSTHAYSASKSGIIALSRAIASDYARERCGST